MDDLEPLKKPAPELYHYYGDGIRKLFVIAGLVMLVALPFFSPLLPVPAYVSVMAILVISVTAGATNPKNIWSVVTDTIVAAGALGVFEYFSVDALIKYTAASGLFLTNQFLALIFFLALYLSAKTWRGMLLRDRA